VVVPIISQRCLQAIAKQSAEGKRILQHFQRIVDLATAGKVGVVQYHTHYTLIHHTHYTPYSLYSPYSQVR
jgi:hypothetical protein